MEICRTEFFAGMPGIDGNRERTRSMRVTNVTRDALGLASGAAAARDALDGASDGFVPKKKS